MREQIYEYRAVVFLDILGFSQLIKANREVEILDALKVIEGLQNQYPYDGTTNIEMSAFSDCIVVSDLVGDGFGVVRIVNYASYLAWKFLDMGVLVRGGVSIGDLYHKNKTVFGPALLEAYELESQLAIYPRILATSEVRAKFIEREAATRSHLAIATSSIFKEDFDMQLHIDLLCPFSSGQPSNIPNARQENGGILVDAHDVFRAKIACIQSAIAKNKSNEMKHLVKLGWLKKYIDGYISHG